MSASLGQRTLLDAVDESKARFPNGPPCRSRRKPGISVPRVERLNLLICPSGGLLTGVSSPISKNISLYPSGKSSLQIRAIPPHQRGVGHRHERGEGCGGRGSVLRARGSQGRSKDL